MEEFCRKGSNLTVDDDDADDAESWSRRDVDRLLAFCRENSLGVIPLVQTAGHLEYLLKHPSRNSVDSTPPNSQRFSVY